MAGLQRLLRRVQGRPYVAVLAAVAMVATTAVVVFAVAGSQSRPSESRRPAAEPSVTGVFEVPPLPTDRGAQAGEVYRPTATTWPQAGTASIALSARATRAAGVPVWVQA